MHCFGHTAYVLQINTELVRPCWKHWLRMSDLSCFWKAHIFSSHSCLSACTLLYLWIQRWQLSFFSSRTDGLEAVKLISRNKCNTITRVGKKNSACKLYYLLSQPLPFNDCFLLAFLQVAAWRGNKWVFNFTFRQVAPRNRRTTNKGRVSWVRFLCCILLFSGMQRTAFNSACQVKGHTCQSLKHYLQLLHSYIDKYF